MINKSYNLCYRLTGDIQLAQELCREVLEPEPGKNIPLKEDVFSDIVQKAARLFLDKQGSYSSGQLQSDEPISEIQAALNSLSPVEKIVVVLHDVYHLSNIQISKLVEGDNIPGLLHRGRLHLKQLLITSTKYYRGSI